MSTRLLTGFTAPLTTVAFTVALTGAPLGKAASPPDPSAPQAVHDAWIDGRVETALALNPHLQPFRIETNVENAVVRLEGTLASPVDRDLALEIARGVEGVESVDSRLQVKEASAPAPDATANEPSGDVEERSFSQWIADATTTARVKTNLLANGTTRALDVGVSTRNDVVTLTGTVASRREKMLAEMVAANTEDITHVKNELKVRESS